MAYLHPTIPDFKAYFARDFPYTDNPTTGVTDADINKAYGQTNFNINPNLFISQANFQIAYLLLAAHYLVTDLRMSSQGLNGQYNWIETSKSVGSVSQSFAVPQKIQDNPYFAQLARTNYGAKYLELIMPLLAGQVGFVAGRTLP